MKNISKYLGAGLLLFTAACSQTQEGDQYTPNKDDAKAIHFIQSSIQKEFPQDAVQGVINVEIARPGNKGAYKVYLATRTTTTSCSRFRPRRPFPTAATP